MALPFPENRPVRRRIPASGEQILRIETGWRMTPTEAGAHSAPAELASVSDWIPARVPGTAAGALAAAGKFDVDAPPPLHDKDIWYVADIRLHEPGERVLVLDGLATIAEVYWNGERVLETDSMFLAHEIPVAARTDNILAICLRALAPHLERKGPRARWRQQLAVPPGLRLARTTLLGHMPGWCPEIHAVGPWRPISLVKTSRLDLEVETFLATLGEDGSGLLLVEFACDAERAAPILRCAGMEAAAARQPGGNWVAQLAVPQVAPWWPHTHGEPRLHEVHVEAAGRRYDLGRTGFRRIEIDRSADGKGFALVVNGVPVFSRGAVWTNADLITLPCDPDSYRPWLELAAEAGMNMLRIGGTMAYEGQAFFDLCDELGLMVWQDFQFANYDYPVADEGFAASVREEARQLLGRTQANPSLAVLCGGSEIYQQAAMLGLPEDRYKGELTEGILPRICGELRPDVPYVPNSPCGGALPFSPNEGIAHYYGVSAYRRPIEDARRADVRFASECLAFSNVPQQRTLDACLPVMPGHDPRWKARVPRDRGVGWDFEDVRDHYFRMLYGLEPMDIRYGDPGRYLDFSRATTGEVMEATIAEWRRAASPCAGALVWTYQDLAPGAGWGVVDSTGEPKPAWYALKRAFRPLQVCLTDEGTNGLAVHVINETAADKNLLLTLACLRDGATPVVVGRRELSLDARQNVEFAATEIFGAFFDATYAFRFGPPAHDVVVARLRCPENGAVLADAYHFPLGYPKGRIAPSVEAGVERNTQGEWSLRLVAERFAQAVHIEDDNFRPEDDWFHLAPGAEKRVRLFRRRDANPQAAPNGTLTALNTTGQIAYRGE